jgi:putative endonuclease
VKPSRAGAGRAGEDAAAASLEGDGYSILARNFRWPGGEVDIVAEKGELLIFVEVKAWSGLGTDALADSIGPTKRRRIVETSKIFLARHREYSSRRVRYDVVFVRDGRALERYESAFTGDV